MPPCVRTLVLHPQSRIRKTNETKKAVTEQVRNSVTAVSALILLFEENGKCQWQGGGKPCAGRRRPWIMQGEG